MRWRLVGQTSAPESCSNFSDETQEDVYLYGCGLATGSFARFGALLARGWSAGSAIHQHFISRWDVPQRR